MGWTTKKLIGFLAGAQDFSVLQSVLTAQEAYQTSQLMSCFPGIRQLGEKIAISLIFASRSSYLLMDVQRKTYRYFRT